MIILVGIIITGFRSPLKTWWSARGWEQCIDFDNTKNLSHLHFNCHSKWNTRDSNEWGTGVSCCTSAFASHHYMISSRIARNACNWFLHSIIAYDQSPSLPVAELVELSGYFFTQVSKLVTQPQKCYCICNFSVDAVKRAWTPLL